MANILELWNSTFKEETLVDVKELAKKPDPYELFDFTVILQIIRISIQLLRVNIAIEGWDFLFEY